MTLQKRCGLGILAGVAGFCFLLGGAADADVLFTSYTGESASTSNVGRTIGTTFTTGSLSRAGEKFKITHLGIYDNGGDGLSEAHEVGIWNGSGALVTSGIVGTDSTLDGDWRYSQIVGALTATYLDQNSTYTIAGLVENSTDLNPFEGTLVGDSDISLTFGSVFSASATGVLQNPGVSNNNRRGFANAMFSVVPEPSSLAFLGFAGVACCAGRRSRRRSDG